MSRAKTRTEERALELLGQGLSTGVVASALGVTDSAISQLLADENFASDVQKLRFDSLQKSTQLDSTYTDIEEKLLETLEESLPLINKPRDILSAINVINGAKRRGLDSPDSGALEAKVVQLTVPAVLQQKFVVNIANQVTEVQGDQINQTLVTATAGDLDELVKEHGTGQRKQLLAGSGEAEDAGSEESFGTEGEAPRGGETCSALAATL